MLLNPANSIAPQVTSAFPARCRRVNQSSNSPTNRNSRDRGTGKRKRETIFFIKNMGFKTPLVELPIAERRVFVMSEVGAE